jgi:mannosyl-3-phosphoglycerate phosphatase
MLPALHRLSSATILEDPLMSGNRPLWWRQSFTQPADGLAQRLVVVTDIDGSLLEPGTRSKPDERAALDFLAARGIPLVINSSRTRAEIERLHQTLQLLTPFISEHGSALFVPHGAFPFVPARGLPAVGGSVIEFGRRYHEVVEALRLTTRELGVDIVGFAELTIEDVAHELGVPIVEAQLAKLREYTELFRIVDEKDAVRSRLIKALRRRGLRCWRIAGHHLVTGTRDRAESLGTFKAMWREAWGEPLIVGFGDSEDDVAWLQHADVAVFVQHDRTGVPPRVLSKLPTVHVTRSPGRAGWSEAIFESVGALLNGRDQTLQANGSGRLFDARSEEQPP